MWEAVVAILGGAYYTHKIAKEKREAAEFDRAVQQNIVINDGLGVILCASAEEERKVDEFVRYDNKDAIYEKLKTELTNAFGEDYKNQFVLFGDKPDGTLHTAATSPIYWAKMLLLSQLGKVRKKEYGQGFLLGGPDEVDFNKKIIEQIDRNVNAEHLWAHLIMDPSSGLTEKYRYNPVNKYVRFKHQVPARYMQDPRTVLW